MLFLRPQNVLLLFFFRLVCTLALAGDEGLSCCGIVFALPCGDADIEFLYEPLNERRERNFRTLLGRLLDAGDCCERLGGGFNGGLEFVGGRAVGGEGDFRGGGNGD